MVPQRAAASDTYARIYRVVRRIPEGKVATYGQIAALVGNVGARQVGYALHALRDDTVPWQRVINAKGEISPRPEADHQRVRLLAEGVVFDGRGRVDLHAYRWRPRRR
ncbi:MAG: MGMT family protein [Sandaracinaceae bacterium]